MATVKLKKQQQQYNLPKSHIMALDKHTNNFAGICFPGFAVRCKA